VVVAAHSDIVGPAGRIEVAIDAPEANARGIAVLCHPHPVHGGTMDNKVIQTLARAFVQLGQRAVRFNFRGVGRSDGQWDEGVGEIDDAMAVVAAQRDGALPLTLAGFSFGGYVAAQVAQRLSAAGQPAHRLVLVAPATTYDRMPTVPADALIIHGEADDVVPLKATLDWARPQGLPVIVLPGVGHFFHGQLTRLRDLVLRGGGPRVD
jgi:alpha/beta superfamily hydrolase